MHLAQEPDALEGGDAHQDVGVVGGHAVVLICGEDLWCASLKATAVFGLSRKKMRAFRDIGMCGLECGGVSTAYFGPESQEPAEQQNA